jgi:hypothetical protein
MILPRPITLSGPIAVHVDLYDADGQKPTSRFRWFINGNAVTGVSGPELRPDLIRRGDMVAVEVIASDGQIESMPYRTEDIEVINSPPIVTRVTIEAEGGSVPGRIHANVEAADPDHDEIQLAYRWWRNDKLIYVGIQPERRPWSRSGSPRSGKGVSGGSGNADSAGQLCAGDYLYPWSDEQS